MRRITVISFLIFFTYIVVSAVPVFAAENLSLYTASGFFITPNVIVTNHHVIKGASRIEIVYNNQIQISASVIGSDEVSDLALLRVQGLEGLAEALPLANSGSVRQGDRVYAVGFPLPQVMGMQAKLSEGLISATAGMRGDLRMYQISAPVQPGNSGGPLLNDRAEVVGVVAGCLDATVMMKQGIFPQNVNYAVKSDNLYGLIHTYGVEIAVAGCRNDQTLTAADVMEVAKKAIVFIMVIK